MIQGKTVAVVIPAYRVEKEIAGVVGAMPEFVDRIIVVDDASPDRTAEIVGGISDPRLQLIRHPRNQGVGGAMATGFGGTDFTIRLWDISKIEH